VAPERPDARPDEPRALADPRPASAALARAALGYDGERGMGAVTATARIGQGGGDVAVGLAAATAPARPWRAEVEALVPVLSTWSVGTRVTVAVELPVFTGRSGPG
jgi:hypothetical protein